MKLQNLIKTNFHPAQVISAFTVGILLIVLGMVGISQRANRNVAQAFTEPSCTNSPTTPTFNPYPLTLQYPNPTFNPCMDIPLLNFFPVTNQSQQNVREKTLLAGENVSFMVYYNPQGIDATINNPVMKVQIDNPSATKYTMKAQLESGNANLTSTSQTGKNGLSNGDLVINVPAGYKLEAVLDSGLHYPQRQIREEIKNQTGKGVADTDPNYPSVITAFENATFQPTSQNGFNFSYQDTNKDGVKDANSPNSVKGGFTNYGYYLFSLAAVQPAPTQTDLELTKTVNNATPVQNTNIEYTVTVKNTSTVNATGVTVKDVLPTGLTYVSAAPNQFNNTTGIWTVGNLNAGETKTLKITAKVVGTGKITNIAQIQTASPDDVDSTPGNNIPTEDDQDSVDVNVKVGNVDLEIIKTITSQYAGGSPKPGQEIMYELKYRNTGNNPATGVVITDTFNGNKVQYIDGSCSPACTASGNTLTWNIGTLQPSQNYSIITYKMKIKEGVTGKIDNIALIKDDKGNKDDDDATITAPNPASPDLTISKTVDVGNNTQVKPNQEITYNLKVTNIGGANANNFKVTDLLSEKVTFVSCNNSCITTDQDSRTLVTWTVESLSPQATVNLSVKVKIKADATGNVINSGKIICETINTNATNSAACCASDDCDSNEVINPIGIADIYILKTVNNNKPTVGEVITYTINYANPSDVNLTGVVITDNLPTGITYQANSCLPVDRCTYNSTTRTLTWNIGSLASKATGSVSFKTAVNSSSTTVAIDLNILFGGVKAHADETQASSSISNSNPALNSSSISSNPTTTSDMIGKTITNLATIDSNETGPESSQVDVVVQGTGFIPETPRTGGIEIFAIFTTLVSIFGAIYYFTKKHLAKINKKIAPDRISNK